MMIFPPRFLEAIIHCHLLQTVVAFEIFSCFLIKDFPFNGMVENCSIPQKELIRSVTYAESFMDHNFLIRSWLDVCVMGYRVARYCLVRG